MKTKTIYNLDTIVSIEIEDRVRSGNLIWKPEKKGKVLWLFPYRNPAGIYHNLRGNPFGMNDTCMGKTPPEKYMVVNKVDNGNITTVVYYRPCVTLYLVKGSVTKYFDTYDEAERWGHMKANRIGNKYSITTK